MAQKNLKINENTHDIIKEYCKNNSLKIGLWAESILLREISNETKKPSKSNKKV